MKGIISRLFIILEKDERRRLFVMAGIDLLMGLVDVAFLAGLLFIIRVYTGSGTFSAEMNGFSTYIKLHPIAVTGTFMLLFAIKNATGIWAIANQHKYVFAVASRLSKKNINNYFKDDYNRFINVDSSHRARHISNVPVEFSSYILTNFQQVIAQGLLIVFTTTAILLYHPLLFILLLVLLTPPVLLLGRFTRGRLKKVRTQIKHSAALVIQYLQESLAGYIEANIYSKADFFAQRYYRHQQQLNESIAGQQTLQASSSRVIEVFALLGFFILVIINTLIGNKSSINVLTIGIFMAAAYKIIPGVVKIMNSITQMRTYSFILDDLVAETMVRTEISAEAEHIGNIRFENVCFSFNDRDIVNNLNFELTPGDIAGISGTSGKGKTTILNLLLGFLQQESGQIVVNNKITAHTTRKNYHSRIAYVKQQSFFINDTILKNITLTENGHNKDRLAQSIQISGLDILLNMYPEGINKVLKEHGKNISGGQRQRVALARALYQPHDLLILDEPFSELDETAEQEILSRLVADSDKGDMVLLITHNKASLSFCNKIISV